MAATTNNPAFPRSPLKGLEAPKACPNRTPSSHRVRDGLAYVPGVPHGSDAGGIVTPWHPVAVSPPPQAAAGAYIREEER